MSIANALTLGRIIISPLFLLVYAFHDELYITQKELPFVLLFFLIITECSDAFDGYLARKFNQVTDFGKIIDPMADSICHLSIFLTFTLPPVNLPVWMIFLFFYRDSVISTLRTLCALRGMALAARTSGKIKAILQAIAAFAVVLMMIPHAWGTMSDATLTLYSTWIVGAAAVYSVFSIADYIFANRLYIARTLKPKKKSNLKNVLDST